MRLDERNNLLIELFHSNSPGSQVIVADVTNGWRVMETRRYLVLELSQICEWKTIWDRTNMWIAKMCASMRDLVLELSREPFEIEQICQWLKCAPRWEEQSINRVFHSNSPGSQVIVADVTNGWRVMETPWDLVLELSREPFEIEEICQCLKCAPRWEEQSINRVYHSKSQKFEF